MDFRASARNANGKQWEGKPTSLNDALGCLHEFLRSVPDDERWHGAVMTDDGDEAFSIEWAPKAKIRSDADAYSGSYAIRDGEATQLAGNPPVYKDVPAEFLDVEIEWNGGDSNDAESWQIPHDDDAHHDGFGDLRSDLYDATDSEPYELMEEAVCRRNGFAWDTEKFNLGC